jgi:hypothetical protein
MSSSFHDFLARSLRLLRREHTPAYGALCRTLAGRRSVVTVDGEAVTIHASRLDISIRPGDAPPGGSVAARCQTTRRAILDLLNAELELMDAIRQDRLVLEGALLDLVAFHDALVLYVNGAVRCVSFPALRDEFFADCAERGLQPAALQPAALQPAALQRLEQPKQMAGAWRVPPVHGD